MKKNYLLYFNFGIEVGNFLYSGLAKELAKSGRVTAISHSGSKILKDACGRHGVRLFVITKQAKKRHKIESYFLACRRARLRLRGFTTHQFNGRVVKRRLKDYFLALPPLFILVQTLYHLITKQYYNDSNIKSFIKKHGVTDLVMQSYSDTESMTFGFTAANSGVETYLFHWGWKDFYVNEYVPFPVKIFFVVSKDLKKLYPHFCPHLIGRVENSGHLTYSKLRDRVPNRSKQSYEELYQLEPDQKYLVYTLINPLVYDEEVLIVEDFICRLNQTNSELVVFLKPNPMDPNSNQWTLLEQRYKNVRVMRELWLFDELNNFNMPTEESIQEWYDLLRYSEGVVGVPSTVSLEALAAGKVVFNPLFDHTNKVQSKFEVLYKAPFYERLHEVSCVYISRNIEELISQIERLSVNDYPNVTLPKEIIDLDKNALGAISSLMTNETGSRRA